ncbi:hypothetical protein QL285_093482 [Trifolium repens]|nr:hypothetical protein QL285_093482 [Trifolium repens]
MTKTDPNMKKNLQNQGKASRPSPGCKKTRKNPKSEENVLIIVARWLPSCHDGSYYFGKEINRENLLIAARCIISQHDASYRSTMTLLGDQVDKMHRISYNFELNLPIVLRLTYRSTTAY